MVRASLENRGIFQNSKIRLQGRGVKAQDSRWIGQIDLHLQYSVVENFLDDDDESRN